MTAIKRFNDRLFKISSERGFWLKPLGHLDGYITWLIMTKKPGTEDGPRILIIGGVHGEEQAGPWAILEWMEQCDELILARANLSFIPIVNSYGWVNKKRYGLSDVPTNGGFGEHKTMEPSPEGQILVNNIGLLRPLAEDGFISLHEDVTVDESYLYTIERADKPTKRTKLLRKELSKYFPKTYTGVAYVGPTEQTGPWCEKGLVFNFIDESFEALLFQLGVSWCAVPETPGKAYLKKRILAQQAMINKFVELSGVE